MLKRNIIFVGGIHGVGKTTYCLDLARKFNFEHYSAGDLIKKTKNDRSSNKKVSSVLQNQDILLEAISKYFSDSRWYILDGHFCLLDDCENVTDVPLQTFKEIMPKGILLLESNPTEIQSRLNKRDGKEYKLDLLDSFQRHEMSRAHLVAQELSIPCIVANTINSSSDSAEVLLKKLITGNS